MPNEFNTNIINEFHANAGMVAGPFEGAQMLLLTTTGERIGNPLVTPLAPYIDPNGVRACRPPQTYNWIV